MGNIHVCLQYVLTKDILTQYNGAQFESFP